MEIGCLGLVVIFLVAFVIVPLATRGWHLNWGAAAAEINKTLPGDELVPHPKSLATRAITIDAPPDKVWPWIVQIGYQRAGWYTYDWFYKMTGSAGFVDNGSSDRIVAELQDIKVGDKININKMVGYEILQLDKPRYLVMLSRTDTKSGKTFDLKQYPEQYMNGDWIYFLEPLPGGKTRLILRQYGDWRGGIGTFSSSGPLEFGAFIMARKHLIGIKKRAESH